VMQGGECGVMGGRFYVISNSLLIY
jgi:hypothetical protein